MLWGSAAAAAAPLLLLLVYALVLLTTCNGFTTHVTPLPTACSGDGSRSRLRALLASTSMADADADAAIATSNNFWSDPSCVSALPDPPSEELLATIRAKPYKGGFEPAVDVSEPYEPKIRYGSIPHDLVGSLASNGAGRIRVGDTQYGHWFDGCGFVSMLSLDGRSNKALFNGRYVRSGRFKAQEQLMEKFRYHNNIENLAHPPLAFSGAWTKKGRGKWYENIGRFPTSPANTATMWTPSATGDGVPRLFALCEGGSPIELDPTNLELIRDETPLSSADGSDQVRSFFSAHFQRCPVTGDIYNHGFLIRPGPLPKEMNVCKLSPDGCLVAQARSPLPFDCLTHDSAMSANHLVFFLPPYYIATDRLPSLLTGTGTLGSLLEWHEEDTAYVQINSRDDLKMLWRIALPTVTSLYHFVDAYEFEEVNEDTSVSICLQVRIAEHDPPVSRIALEKQFANQYRVNGDRVHAELKEYTFRLDKGGEGTLVKKSNVADDSVPCEFPVVNSAFRPIDRRRYCWINALSDPSVDWLDGIQKIDMETSCSSNIATFGPGSYAGPPAFVAKENMTAEDDGYILTTVYRSFQHRSDVVVIDAATLETLCILELRHHLPFQFHGDYIPGYVC